MMRVWQDKKEGLISLVALLVLLVVVAILLIVPVFNQADNYRRELRKDARLLQELRAIEAAQVAINTTQKDFEERGLQQWAYTNATADDVKLDVQRRVSDWLSATEVQRITPLVKQEVGRALGVGVHAQFSTSLDELFNVFNNIEQARPLLVLDRLRITPLAQRRSLNQPEPPQRIMVEMTVLTFISDEAGQ